MTRIQETLPDARVGATISKLAFCMKELLCVEQKLSVTIIFIRKSLPQRIFSSSSFSLYWYGSFLQDGACENYDKNAFTSAMV